MISSCCLPQAGQVMTDISMTSLTKSSGIEAPRARLHRPIVYHWHTMPRIGHKYSLVLALCLPALGALAAERCPPTANDWTCFSEIELKASPTAPLSRMFIYPNSEILAEIEQGTTTKRYLVAQPSGVQLYAGLSEDESSSAGAKNPFQFAEMGFAVPVMALNAAFPKGPASVPNGESKNSVSLQGKSVTVTTTRHSATAIAFRLEITGFDASGQWKRFNQKPLPDSFSLVGWTNAKAVQFATLGDARAAH
jgi:hypothetical protein